MAASYTVGDLVAEALAALEVRTAFGISSVHNIPLLDAVARRNSLRFVMVRGEMGGAHMADAYARVTGGLGVVISSTGPGAANTVPGLVEARAAGSPVLHITGTTATRFLGRDTGTVHDNPGQSAMLTAAGKAAFLIRRPEEAFGTLMAAAAEALSPRKGPVTVEIPIDIQHSALDRPAMLDRMTLPVRPAAPADPASVRALADIVEQARRPMLWLGNGAKEAGEGARALLDLGFGAVSSWNGRGIVPEDHPAALGALNGSGTPRVGDFFATVDLMVVAGSRLRGHETMENQLGLPDRRVQIDVDPRAAGRTYGCEMFVRGDIGPTLSALSEELAERGYRADATFQPEIEALREATRHDYRQTIGAYESFPQQLRDAVSRDCVFIRDATVAGSTWGHRLVPLYGPRDSLHSVGAAIGLGVPLGIGAAVAADEQGRRALTLVGDGGLALSMNELVTAVQERTPLTIVVMNDGMYAAIGHMQDAMAGGRQVYHELSSPDLVRLAEVVGLPAVRVGAAEDFGRAVARTMKIAGPALVEVDMSSIGPAPAYSSWGGAPRT